MKQDENPSVKKEINIFYDEKANDLQEIIDNLLLEIYKTRFLNCRTKPFGV